MKLFRSTRIKTRDLRFTGLFNMANTSAEPFVDGGVTL